jgi:hypothetical protein
VVELRPPQELPAVIFSIFGGSMAAVTYCDALAVVF